MTAKELIEKLKNDEKYISIVEEKERKIKKEIDLLDNEYKEFAQDCKNVGYILTTAWDLIDIKEPYPRLIPVLLKYLEEENHSPKFREGIARAMAVSDSSPYFFKILKLYHQSGNDSGNVKWAIACALSVAAQNQEQYDVIEKMIKDKSLGTYRNALLYTVRNMEDIQKKRLSEFIKHDSQLSINFKGQN